jgi:hypothetical protein
MSVRHTLLICALLAGGIGTAELMLAQWRNAERRPWKSDAIRASLEMVVPAHNDASFRYELENCADSDYRITEPSDVVIVQKSESGEQSAARQVSGEFPLWAPARRKVHFALVWTADRDIDLAGVPDFLNAMNLNSFVLFDKVHGCEIDFPARR